MIMQREEGGAARRPRASHPWRRHRSADDEPAPEPLNQKACMAVSETELRAIRARAGGRSISEFLRRHFPAEILQLPAGLAES